MSKKTTGLDGSDGESGLAVALGASLLSET